MLSARPEWVLLPPHLLPECQAKHLRGLNCGGPELSQGCSTPWAGECALQVCVLLLEIWTGLRGGLRRCAPADSSALGLKWWVWQAWLLKLSLKRCHSEDVLQQVAQLWVRGGGSGRLLNGLAADAEIPRDVTQKMCSSR